MSLISCFPIWFPLFTEAPLCPDALCPPTLGLTHLYETEWQCLVCTHYSALQKCKCNIKTVCSTGGKWTQHWPGLQSTVHHFYRTKYRAQICSVNYCVPDFLFSKLSVIMSTTQHYQHTLCNVQQRGGRRTEHTSVDSVWQQTPKGRDTAEWGT